MESPARDPQRQRALAEQLATRSPELLEQVDTFFHVASGRLKLRVLSSWHGELIYYQRPDQAGPKESVYSIVPTAQPQALCKLLAQAIGIRGEVRKRRWLYRVGQSRIHLDEVESLGTFLEVEVVVQAGQSISEAASIAAVLQRDLQVQDEHLVPAAYIDLLAASCTS